MIKENRKKLCATCSAEFICRNRKEIESRLFCSGKCRAKHFGKIYSVQRLGSGNPMFGKQGWNKGKKFSKKYREKLSNAHKGLPGYWDGKKRATFSEEWIKNISNGLNNRNESEKEKWKYKLSSSLKGRKITWVDKLKKPKSSEHKENISKSKMGDKNPNWHGGNYIDHSKSPRYKRWRYKIAKLDNFTCIECGSKDRIHVHHIKNKKDYPEFMFDDYNGITLCKKCHDKTLKKEELFVEYYTKMLYENCHRGRQ